MQIITMPLGAYQTNCYLVSQDDSRQCVIIDPGYHPEQIMDRVKAEGKQVQAILLTHGHFDHVGAVRELAAETGCAVYLCQEDLSMPPAFTAGPLYYTDLYSQGDTLCLAGLSFQVLHTPGHTPGSVCLLCEKAIFSGDTLFRDSCGRTDLPGGNPAAILKSLRHLADLAGDYTVYPGHGPSTSLSYERKYNPYMKGEV